MRRGLHVWAREHDQEAADQEGDGGEDGILHHQAPGQPAHQRREGAAEAEGDRVGAQPRARRAAVEPARHELAAGVDDRRHEPQREEVEVQPADVVGEGHQEKVGGEQAQRDRYRDLASRPRVQLR